MIDDSNYGDGYEAGYLAGLETARNEIVKRIGELTAVITSYPNGPLPPRTHVSNPGAPVTYCLRGPSPSTCTYPGFHGHGYDGDIYPAPAPPVSPAGYSTRLMHDYPSYPAAPSWAPYCPDPKSDYPPEHD